MPGVVTLVVYALAVARLTRLAVIDEITRPAREALVRRFNPHRRAHRWIVYMMGEPADEDAAGCPWCTSVWISAVAAPLVWAWGEHPALFIPATALAFAQVAGMIAGYGRG